MRFPICNPQSAIRIHAQRGFSLVELIVVIVLLGILSAATASFIQGPVLAYFATARRAAMTDAADTAARRMLRDVQAALPNSIRITQSGGTLFMELLPIDDAGRYRAASGENIETAADALDVSGAAESSFDVIGRPVTVPATVGGRAPQLVVYNLGIGDADVWTGGNRRSITTAAGSAAAISFAPTANALGVDSPTHRFFIVTSAVTYVCTPAADGSGRVERFSDYAPQAAQPLAVGAAPLDGARRALLVDGVSACSFEQSSALANSGSVRVSLTLTRGGESVNLLVQAYVANTP